MPLIDKQYAVAPNHRAELVIIEHHEPPMGIPTVIVRYSIHMSAVPGVSLARVENWGGTQWHLVHELLPTSMEGAIPESLAVKDHELECFDIDYDQLRKVARQLLHFPNVSRRYEGSSVLEGD